MTAAHKLLTTCFPDDEGGGPPGEGSWSDDVFSTYLYTGNGTAQTINNGIDLAGKRGLVWTKNRNNSFGNSGQIASTSHFLWDFTIGKYLNSDSDYAGTSISNEFQPLSNGFLVNTSHPSWNASGGTQLQTSWTFRNAPKFFQTLSKTHTTGTASTLSLAALGTVGMVLVKRLDAAGDWLAWHRGLSAGTLLALNSTAAAQSNPSISVSGTTLTMDASLVSGSYIIYAWAHDTSLDGIIQCGSFTTDGSGNATVNLGWEPQYILYKNVQGVSGDISWRILDSMRGFTVGSDASLLANYPNTESTSSFANPIANGFKYNFGTNANQQFIYLAIRRSNKTPTTGTQVYNTIDKSIINNPTTVDTGFAPDLVITRDSRVIASNNFVIDRLRGASSWAEATFYTNASSAEILSGGRAVLNNSSIGVTIESSTPSYWASCFRRAKGFFDTVCYTGNAIPHSEAHSLGVVPEMMWVKRRDYSADWRVYHKDIGNDRYLVLNETSQKSPSITTWNTTTPSASTFSVGTDVEVNTNTGRYVAYLFASLSGVSKVGSYTGNGASQLINCAFSTGSRFVLIKRVDSTGDWYLWDSARGIHPTADPHLSLNTTAAEVSSDDSIDQDINGFIVNQDVATNINVIGGQYIFYAIS